MTIWDNGFHDYIKFKQRKKERIEQLMKDRRESKKRKKQNQIEERGDNSEIVEEEDRSDDSAMTIDQLQKDLNELAALLSQKT